MKCIICDEYIHEGNPHEEIGNVIYCGDCALIKSLITEKQYIKKYLYWLSLDGLRVAVHDGKIYISAYNKPFPFEMKTQDFRKTEEYKTWRAKVFDRDGFKCQICGKVGGVLNAHHIKEFSKHPELRYEIDNGITLCESCHKKYTERRNRKWPADKTK